MRADHLPPPLPPAPTPDARSRPSLLVRAAACIAAAILVLVFAHMLYWHTSGAGRDFRSLLPPLLVVAWTTVWTLGAAALLLTRVGMLAGSPPRRLLRAGPWLLTAFFGLFALLHVGAMADDPTGDWQIDMQGPLLLLLAGLCIVVASEEPAT